jgi:SAM-dependent methyltransferase
MISVEFCKMASKTVALDPTFRNYDPNQAAAFAKARKSYSEKLYDLIIEYHQANGGQLHSLLDVGCGSGAATRGLAQYLDNATGIDPGEQLIQQARIHGGQTASGTPVQYEVLSAEDMCLSRNAAISSVDILTASMAVRESSILYRVSPPTNVNQQAHWFDLEKFWPNAARMVKIGGTVALWTNSSLYCRKIAKQIHVRQMMSI